MTFKASLLRPRPVNIARLSLNSFQGEEIQYRIIETESIEDLRNKRFYGNSSIRIE